MKREENHRSPPCQDKTLQYHLIALNPSNLPLFTQDASLSSPAVRALLSPTANEAVPIEQRGACLPWLMELAKGADSFVATCLKRCTQTHSLLLFLLLHQFYLVTNNQLQSMSLSRTCLVTVHDTPDFHVPCLISLFPPAAGWEAKKVAELVEGAARPLSHATRCCLFDMASRSAVGAPTIFISHPCVFRNKIFQISWRCLECGMATEARGQKQEAPNAEESACLCSSTLMTHVAL